MSDALSDAVSYEAVGDVAVITMDDGKANAIGWDLLDGLEAAVDRAENEDAKALVLIGRDGKFSAGFDLKVVQTDRVLELMGRGGALALRLWSWPTPLVYAVTGHAMAMGAVLLACADYRVGASGDFKIGLNEIRIGLAVPDFAAEVTRSRLNPKYFHRATFLAELFDPETAVEVGYLDEVVAAEQCRERAIAVATAAAADLVPNAFRATRRIIRGELAARFADMAGPPT